jgi:hypothetical protein
MPLADSENKPNFWTTMPGFLTGLAAVLTAVTGLLVVMHPHGSSESKDKPAVTASPSDAPGAASNGAGAVPTGAGGTSVSSAAMPKQQKPTVLVQERDGSETRVFLNGFKDSYSGEFIQLKNGQSIPFDKIKLVDFMDLRDYDQEVKVTLIDGRTLEGTIQVGEQITGSTDIGPFSISVRSLKRISFER